MLSVLYANKFVYSEKKSTLKQRCIFQHWNLQRQTMSNQCCVFQR